MRRAARVGTAAATGGGGGSGRGWEAGGAAPAAVTVATAADVVITVARWCGCVGEPVGCHAIVPAGLGKADHDAQGAMGRSLTHSTSRSVARLPVLSRSRLRCDHWRFYLATLPAGWTTHLSL